MMEGGWQSPSLPFFIRKGERMEKLGAFMLLALAAYFIYSIYSSLHGAKQRRDAADKSFGTYAEHSQEEWDALYAQWSLQEKTDQSGVDDITWNDLDMNLVFHRINACMTTPGEEELYNRLRALQCVEDDWEITLAALDQNPSMRLHIQTLLSHVGKNCENSLPGLIKAPEEYRLAYSWLFQAAAYLPLAGASLLFVPGVAAIGLAALILTLMLNAYLYYWGGRQLRGRIHTMHYLKSLLWFAKKVSRMPMPGLEAQKKRLKAAVIPFVHTRGTFSVTAQEGMIAGDIGALMMFFQVFFLTELRAYNRMMSVACKHVKELDALYRSIGRLDVLVSTLSFRKSLPNYCLPHFRQQTSVSAEDIVHPLLQNGVANNIRFCRGVLLTGSNASGKSTFIKALAINAIMAQSINTCTAASFALPRARVISSMALRDNLSDGESYFVVEVKSFRRILQAVNHSPCLCFVDEILRGTNTIERIAASTAVLKSLQTGSSLCVAATHDIELTELLSGQYDNYHFKEEIKDKGVFFDYTLRQGPSKTRNALLLLQAYDFPEKVVQEASDMVKGFEREHCWMPIQEKEGGGCSAPAQAG